MFVEEVYQHCKRNSKLFINRVVAVNFLYRKTTSMYRNNGNTVRKQDIGLLYDFPAKSNIERAAKALRQQVAFLV